MGKHLTIQEAIAISGKSKTTIYRYINRGKLTTHKKEFQGKDIYTVKLKDLESCLGYELDIDGIPMGIPGDNCKSHGNTMGVSWESHGNTTQEYITRENLANVMEEILSQRETKLMKPLEELATYKVGKLENEIQHLISEKETLRQENELLREAMKALPGPVEKVVDELKEKDQKLEEQFFHRRECRKPVRKARYKRL